MPVNPCNLRKGISKYKIKHKSIFQKGLTFELKDKKMTYPFLLGIQVLVKKKPKESREELAGSAILGAFVTFAGSCQLFHAGVFIITFLIMTYHLSSNWQGA